MTHWEASANCATSSTDQVIESDWDAQSLSIGRIVSFPAKNWIDAMDAQVPGMTAGMTQGRVASNREQLHETTRKSCGFDNLRHSPRGNRHGPHRRASIQDVERRRR